MRRQEAGILADRRRELLVASRVGSTKYLYFSIGEKETVASARFHGGHPVHHIKGVCAGSAGGPAGHFEAR